MIFWRRFTSGIRTAVNQGLRPIRNVRNQASRMRSNNVFTQSKRRIASMHGRLRYYTKMPARYLGISSKREKSREDDNKKPDYDISSDDAKSYALGGTAERLHKKITKRNRRKAPSTISSYTQIHLFDSMSGQREIIHLGFGSGRSQVKHSVNGKTFLFTQADPESETDNSVLFSTTSPDVRVNGYPVEGTILLPQGSEIYVDGRRFQVDLQTRDQLAERINIHADWGTDVGPARRENEDAVGIYHAQDAYLFAIADGVGSGYGGDKMSEFTINYLLSAFDMNQDTDVLWEDVLSQAVQNANVEVRNFLKNLKQHAGTTLTALVIDGWVATVLHVGDSRLYLLRNEILEQITQDHSEEIPVDNATTYDVVETRIVLAKAVGKTNTITPDVFKIELQAGDRLLLCTDGITSRIPDSELSDILSTKPLKNLTDYLINLSNDRHNTDNASAIVVDVTNTQSHKMSWDITPQDRVFMGDDEHVFRYKKIERVAVSKPERDEVEDSEEGSIGCGCLILGLLIVALGLMILWGSGILYDARQDNAQPQIVEQNVELTPILTPIPVDTETVSSTLTINTQEVSTSTPNDPVIIATVAPSSTSAFNVTIELVSPTVTQSVGITSTVRPTNPPR